MIKGGKPNLVDFVRCVAGSRNLLLSGAEGFRMTLDPVKITIVG